MQCIFLYKHMRTFLCHVNNSVIHIAYMYYTNVIMLAFPSNIDTCIHAYIHTYIYIAYIYIYIYIYKNVCVCVTYILFT